MAVLSTPPRCLHQRGACTWEGVGGVANWAPWASMPKPIVGHPPYKITNLRPKTRPVGILKNANGVIITTSKENWPGPE